MVVGGLMFFVRWFKRLRDLWEDVNGAPGRPGVPGLPSIRESVAHMNDKIDSMSQRVEDIEKEIKHNGGGSIKDVVHSLDEKIDVLQAHFTRHLLNSGENRPG